MRNKVITEQDWKTWPGLTCRKPFLDKIEDMADKEGISAALVLERILSNYFKLKVPRYSRRIK